MSQPIWIASRSITREDVPLRLLAGTMDKTTRADGKYLITLTDGGFYQMRSDGLSGSQAVDPNGEMGGATLFDSAGRFGLLEFTCEKNFIGDSGVAVTQLVAWWNRL